MNYHCFTFSLIYSGYRVYVTGVLTLICNFSIKTSYTTAHHILERWMDGCLDWWVDGRWIGGCLDGWMFR